MHSPVRPRSLAAGWFGLLGPGDRDARHRLDVALRQRFRADAVVFTDSGTSALALAIMAARRRHPGAPVAMPAYGCYDLATAAAAADAPVLLYDLDPNTLGPDWSSLERAVHAGAGAVVVAYLFGFPVDLTHVSAICAPRHAIVIEDAAQGAGASWNDMALGGHGPLSVLSFGRGKGITGGSGGVLLARAAGTELMPSQIVQPGKGAARALAALTAQWLLARPVLYSVPSSLPFLRLGETVYRDPHPPRALASGLAAVVLGSLELADQEGRVRRARAQQLADAAAAARVATFSAPPASQPGYLRFPLMVRQTSVDNPARLGIMRGYPLSLADLPPLAERCLNRTIAFPGARALAAHLHTAPVHSRLASRDVDQVVAWIRSLEAD